MQLRKYLFLFGLLALWFACASKQHPSVEPLHLTEKAPLFVSFGIDDNPYSGLPESGGAGGIHYMTELFSIDHKLHYSFYVNTKYISDDSAEDADLVKRSWKEAIDYGNEIGVHTHSHPHGRNFTVEEWEGEMLLCLAHLMASSQLALPRSQLIGFRTPFLEYGDSTFTAAQKTGFVYDCSIEEGYQADQNGTNFIWPYKLDRGSPGNSATFQVLSLPFVMPHPGLWELPVYVFIVPPDNLAQQYGVQPGLRARLKERNDYFDLEQGKITGMDWNLWFEYGMDQTEFLATLKYTLDLHLQGNHCPFTVGLHSAIYSDRSPEPPPQTSVQQRRDALKEFVEYAMSKPEVKIVSAKELLDCMRTTGAARAGTQ